jgi:O-antigen biosynthesis protein
MNDSGDLFGETRAEIATLRTVVAASEELVSHLRQDISSNNQRISALALEQEQLKAELAGARTETDQLRAMVATSENLMPQLRSQTAQILRRVVNVANASRQTLERDLRNREYKTKRAMERQINEERANFNRIIADFHGKIDKAHAQLHALSLQIDQLIGSTSWKISAPIRTIGRRLPALASLLHRILRPMRRLMYLLMRRDKPAIVRSSVVACLPDDFWRIPLQSERGSMAGAPSTDVNAPPTSGRPRSKIDRDVILIAADIPPMHDRHAGGLRLYNIVRMFCEMDRRVVFASLDALEHFVWIAGSEENRKRYEKLLYDAGVERIVYGLDEGERLIRAMDNECCCAFLSLPHVAEQFIPLVRGYAPGASVIYDMVDFHALRMQREADLKLDQALREMAERMRIVEFTNALTADVTIAVSELERRAMLEIDPNLVVEIIPTVFDLSCEVRRDIDRRSGLLFVGGFLHSPNVAAVLWFVRKVWPLIVDKRPDMCLRLVGGNAPAEVLALRDRQGIEVLGYVPDLTDLFSSSRMSVVPLTYGAGVKGKLGQSMAHGLPVVATSIGAEGMPLEHGRHLLLADAPEEFAAAVLQLATDDDLWHRLQLNGRRFIELAQSMHVMRPKLRALLKD